MTRTNGFNFRELAAVMRPDVLAMLPAQAGEQRMLDELACGEQGYPTREPAKPTTNAEAQRCTR